MIRKARPEDAAAIVKIYNYYVHDTTEIVDVNPQNEDDVKEQIINKLSHNVPFLVAQVDDEVVGYCFGQYWSLRGACCKTINLNVFVDKNHIGKGYGKELLNELVLACKSAGYHAIMASVTGGNDRAEALFKSCGFTKVTHFHSLWNKKGKWWDSYDYQLLNND